MSARVWSGISVTVSEPKAIFTPILFALLSLSMNLFTQFVGVGQGFVGRVEPREMRRGKIRADEIRALFLHQLQLSFGQRETVFDGISASPNTLSAARPPYA